MTSCRELFKLLNPSVYVYETLIPSPDINIDISINAILWLTN